MSGINRLLDNYRDMNVGESPSGPFDVGIIHGLDVDSEGRYTGKVDVQIITRQMYVSHAYVAATFWGPGGGAVYGMPMVGSTVLLCRVGIQEIPIVIGMLPPGYSRLFSEGYIRESVTPGDVLVQAGNEENTPRPTAYAKLEMAGKVVLYADDGRVAEVVVGGGGSPFTITTDRATIQIDSDGVIHLFGPDLSEEVCVVTRKFLDLHYRQHTHIGNMGAPTSPPVGQTTLEALTGDWSGKVRVGG